MITSVSILVPLFNEVSNLDMIWRGLRDVTRRLMDAGIGVEVVVIDDGSGDGTWDGVQKWQGVDGMVVKGIRHHRNTGLGGAIRSGLDVVTGDAVVMVDGDGAYDYGDIMGLVMNLGDGVDVVVGSPYHPEGGVEGVAWYRLVLSWGASWLYRRLVGGGLYCYTSLFRAYRRDVVMRPQEDGFLAVTEMLVDILQRGGRVVEYPVVLRGRRGGQSAMAIRRTVVSHVRFMWRMRGERA